MEIRWASLDVLLRALWSVHRKAALVSESLHQNEALSVLCQPERLRVIAFYTVELRSFLKKKK